jgi:hypothetical protein
VTVDDLALLGLRRPRPAGRNAAALELLHAEADALLLDIDVEDLRLDGLALAVKLRASSPDTPQAMSDMWTIPSTSPSSPTNRPNSVEFLTSPSTVEPDRMRFGEGLPRVRLGLLEAERNPALLLVDLEHLHVDFLRSETILPGWTFFFGPAHLGDVDEALDAGFELDERAIFGDVRDPALEHAADRILGRRAFPRIALELLHAEADALRLAVDADDLHLHRVADVSTSTGG